MSVPTDGRICLTPQFVTQALGAKGMVHRFVLILESENRIANPEGGALQPPRFSVGGPRANQDPRICKVEGKIRY